MKQKMELKMKWHLSLRWNIENGTENETLDVVKDWAENETSYPKENGKSMKPKIEMQLKMKHVPENGPQVK